MYLYVPAQSEASASSADVTVAGVAGADAKRPQGELAELPDALLQRFGRAEFCFELALWPERELAQADARTVLDALGSQGFYLQMPPTLTLPETPDARVIQ